MRPPLTLERLTFPSFGVGRRRKKKSRLRHPLEHATSNRRTHTRVAGHTIIMRLTAELIQHALSYLNPLNERELDLRGT